MNSWVLGRCDGAVFHNNEQATAFAACSPKAMVVWSWAMRLRPERDERLTMPETLRPTILAPLSYSFDEPVQELLEAARLKPDWTFLFTGTAPTARFIEIPANVRLTGFVPTPAYQSLLANCDVVICLTTREATMQTGLIEAIEHRKPAVVSESRVLRAWAGRDTGVVFTASHKPADLIRALSEALELAMTGPIEAARERLVTRSVSDIAGLHEAMAGVNASSHNETG